MEKDIESIKSLSPHLYFINFPKCSFWIISKYYFFPKRNFLLVIPNREFKSLNSDVLKAAVCNDPLYCNC